MKVNGLSQYEEVKTWRSLRESPNIRVKSI